MQLEPQLLVHNPIGSSPARRQLALCRTVVATLLLVPVLLVLPPRIACMSEPSRVDRARLQVKRYAYEAFPTWATVHHEALCPDALADLNEYAGRNTTTDPWGTPLEMRCGPGYRGVYVRSAGEDGRFDTADDISSNDA
jgi:hypothetical protein